MCKIYVFLLLLVILSCSKKNDDSPAVSSEAEVTVSFVQTATFDIEGNGGNLPSLILSGTVLTPSTVTVSLNSSSTTATLAEDFQFNTPIEVPIPVGNYDGSLNSIIEISGISILNDEEEEENETFECLLSNPTGDAILGNTTTTQYTIIDDDGLTVSFSQQNALGIESLGDNLPKILVFGTVVDPLEFSVEVASGASATEGEDFEIASPALLTIPPGTYDGSLESSFDVPGLRILDDNTIEPVEFFELDIVTDSDDFRVGISNSRYEINGVIPCVSGMARNNPCNGFDLFGTLGLSVFEASQANDIWGWVDTSSGREFALVGLNNGTAFVEVTTDEPVYLGKLPSATGSSTWRDVKVLDNFAYIVSESAGHGVQIFDLNRLLNVANPPQNFSTTTRYTGIGNAHNIVINERSSFAYPVGTARNDEFNGGVHFIDVQNPTDPVGVGGYGVNGYTHDAQVITYIGPDTDYTGREIFIGSNENQIAIVDITNKANPQEISTLDYTQLSYTHQGWFTEDQRYFLLGDELDEVDFGFNSRTLVFDFTDLDNPVLHSNYLGQTTAIDHNGYVLGDEFYLANYTAGMRLLDLTDIDSGNITEKAYFDTFPSNDRPSFDGAWSVYPYLPSGKILVNDINSGLFVIQKSN